MQRAGANRILPLAVLALALAAVSFGSIFVRLAAAPALAVALWRMTIAAAVVVPVAALSQRSSPSARGLLTAATAGVLLALHFAAWISSLDYTTIAVSVLLVTTAPVWVALLGWACLGMRPTRPTWVAIGLAVSGGVIIAAGGAGGPMALRGQALALAGALAMAGYLLLAKEAQRRLAYLQYVAAAFGTAAGVLWVGVLVSGTPWRGFSGATWGVLAAMAVVSQLIGHGGYNWALRHLQPVFVSITLTGEPVLAAGLAWWLLGETVTASTVLGGALVLSGVAVAARAMRS